MRPEPKPPEVTRVRIKRAEPKPPEVTHVRIVREPEPPEQPPEPLPAEQQARIREHVRSNREKIARQLRRKAEIVDLDDE